MDTDTSHTVDNEQKFWDELDGIVSARCGTHELIDDALRSYLAFTSTYISTPSPAERQGDPYG
ncbi:pre-rRNA processing [Elasticomyces elasticus]|nr:pre-rRNA processing [Elasticomyces elasticus]